MYKAVIFDFDYTLGDSTNGIVLSTTMRWKNLDFERRTRRRFKDNWALVERIHCLNLTGYKTKRSAQKFTQYFKEKADEDHGGQYPAL